MNTKHALQIEAHKAEYRHKRQEERRRDEDANYRRTHPDEFCGYCFRELDYDDGSGFCSVECEERYGECPKCGAPSRNNHVCNDCREP